MDDQVAVIDETALRALLLQMSDDPAAQAEIVYEYLHEAASQLTLLLDAVAAGDLPAAQIVAHTWRSTSSLLGAGRLAALLRRLEQSIEQQPDEVPGLAHQVDTEYAAVHEALARMVPATLG